MKIPKQAYTTEGASVKEFTGISSPYEAPLVPELLLDTEVLSLEESVQRVLRLLREAGILKNESELVFTNRPRQSAMTPS
ncbi:MAG: adenylyl-sulfate kinase [Azonexus sp.]|nr:adenylyl-sulfate kinase [Azonexus sp.]MCK6413738.1 adenylyl-sulfate kinase [Azonexus sp.]